MLCVCYVYACLRTRPLCQSDRHVPLGQLGRLSSRHDYVAKGYLRHKTVRHVNKRFGTTVNFGQYAVLIWARGIETWLGGFLRTNRYRYTFIAATVKSDN